MACCLHACACSLQQLYSCWPCRHAAARCVDVCAAHALTYDDTNPLSLSAHAAVCLAQPAAGMLYTPAASTCVRALLLECSTPAAYIDMVLPRCSTCRYIYTYLLLACSTPAASTCVCVLALQQLQALPQLHGRRERQGERWCHHTSTHVPCIRQRI